MSAQRLLYVQAVTAIAVGALHTLSHDNFSYWNLWWYDVLLHFSGGVWVGLGVMWASALCFRGWRPRALLIVGAVLGVGIAWEAWELLLGTVPEENYVLDTVGDLVMDVAGGAVSLLIGCRKYLAACREV